MLYYYYQSHYLTVSCLVIMNQLVMTGLSGYDFTKKKFIKLIATYVPFLASNIEWGESMNIPGGDIGIGPLLHQ